MLPARALTRNWYCRSSRQKNTGLDNGPPDHPLPLVQGRFDSAREPTYSAHSEVAHNTSALASHYTSVLELGGAGVGVHLGELELCLGTDTLRQCSVADHVAQSLSGRETESALQSGQLDARCDAALAGSCGVPLRLKLGEDLALGVVANVADIDEAAQIEAGGSELRHGGRRAAGGQM